MTINFFPGYSIANEGCFYWGWFPACELQLFLVAPAVVYLLHVKCRGHPVAKGIFLLALISVGSYINYRILFDNNMSAGLFAS
jgi:hypothetical protein